ncbi:UNVERIFIED_CONTAM: hypothetical protein PYX00_011451 [Menopon gallinae]|uniref:Uncharacterized protein n=1 Tax=Menopon gallinae TaxID=328185 RepID=A0AAW2H7R1_9NEOP
MHLAISLPFRGACVVASDFLLRLPPRCTPPPLCLRRFACSSPFHFKASVRKRSELQAKTPWRAERVLILATRASVSAGGCVSLLAAGDAPAQRKPPGVASRKYVWYEAAERVLSVQQQDGVVSSGHRKHGHMRRLRLDKNKLVSLLASIGSMVQLKELSLNNNKLALFQRKSAACEACGESLETCCKAVHEKLAAEPLCWSISRHREIAVENMPEHRHWAERSLASGGARSWHTSRCGKEDEN